jgi:hypothetical protein
LRENPRKRTQHTRDGKELALINPLFACIVNACFEFKIQRETPSDPSSTRPTRLDSATTLPTIIEPLPGPWTFTPDGRRWYTTHYQQYSCPSTQFRFKFEPVREILRSPNLNTPSSTPYDYIRGAISRCRR